MASLDWLYVSIEQSLEHGGDLNSQRTNFLKREFSGRTMGVLKIEPDHTISIVRFESINNVISTEE